MADKYLFEHHGHDLGEPVGLEYIASALNLRGHEFTFVNYIELEIIDQKSDRNISLFTANTSKWVKTVILADTAKKRGNITIVGGYHVSGLSQNINPSQLPKEFDVLIAGEGEEIVLNILDEYASKRTIENYKSKIIRSSQITNLDSLPFPYRDERFLSNYNLLDLIWPPASMQKNVAIVLASRGCQYNCQFCASSTVWGKGVRYRSVNNVMAELQDLKNRFATNMLLVIDQSFGQNKKWTIDLCNSIESARLGMNWYNQSDLSLARETISEMAKAGCTKIGFGLEGISPMAIDFIKPQNPHGYDYINDLFNFCNSLGIFIKVYLIIGFPWETKEIINEYYKWIKKLRANEIKISYFTPFPGTAAWNKYSNSLISTNWNDYDTVQMPVVYNPNISVEEYHHIRQKLFNVFYDSDTYSDVTQQILTKYPHYRQSFKEFIPYLKQFHMITGREKWLRGFEEERKSIGIYVPMVKQAEFLG